MTKKKAINTLNIPSNKISTHSDKDFTINFSCLLEKSYKKLSQDTYKGLINTLVFLSKEKVISIQQKGIKDYKKIPKTSINEIGWTNHHTAREHSIVNGEVNDYMLQFDIGNAGRIYGFFCEQIFYLTIIDQNHKATG